MSTRLRPVTPRSLRASVSSASIRASDGSPVTLLSGRRPAWRELALGVTDGPDVAQLV